ncbi:fumarylacetoacetate (FAA) hydrolase [Luminiphilus syltensis NOR5-1B]|uniref:Fumarylacetoacetate (FAA) hydrolase n=1 Tax=Luminiphilus syltensis NOR5-1B TaxID=565045 RepID=B8KUX2_9GAMM|nr:fumarylacetoacetate hydrolase family protein [Luminiphilus syltensis]EED36545.1 fumarylacetoacetate (FAA) hydrolase [Luminiphilus syltensis NOR5-1B]
MHQVQFMGEEVTPGKIICIGKNYAAHIAEMDGQVPDAMVVFMKPPGAIGDTLHAHAGEPLHYEGEISFLMRDGEVAGIGFGLDLTKRALQGKLKKAGLPWERCKAFDGAALFSEFVPAPANLEALRLETWVDGECRQNGGVSMMLYPPAVMLPELQTFTHFADNDIIMTGTPSGVGEIKPGERFEGRVFDGNRLLVEATWSAV